MFAKLFSRITESSLMEEPIEVRYAFVMLLAICDPTGHVIGTDVAIARRINMPIEDFVRCAGVLMEPDLHSNSKERDGRRIVPSDHERGYLVVNYLTYRDMKTEDQKREYMREYMRKRREGERLTRRVKPCKTKLAPLGQAEGEAEAEEKAEGEASPTILPAALPRMGVTEGKNSNRVPTTPQSKRFAAIFHRRESTPWQENEVTAYQRLGIVPEEDLAAVESYYAKHWPPTRGINILRTDLLTFLNNFRGEVGRAQADGLQPRKNGAHGIRENIIPHIISPTDDE